MSTTITPLDARPTICDGAPGGIDVAFSYTLDGTTYTGGCTLFPCEDGRPGYEESGPLDYWLDGDTCARLRAGEETREMARAIVAACAPVAAAYAVEAAS